MHMLVRLTSWGFYVKLLMKFSGDGVDEGGIMVQTMLLFVD
jgi:hypothetical protein